MGIGAGRRGDGHGHAGPPAASLPCGEHSGRELSHARVRAKRKTEVDRSGTFFLDIDRQSAKREFAIHFEGRFNPPKGWVSKT